MGDTPVPPSDLVGRKVSWPAHDNDYALAYFPAGTGTIHQVLTECCLVERDDDHRLVWIRNGMITVLP